jgi:hypothetical protein
MFDDTDGSILRRYRVRPFSELSKLTAPDTFISLHMTPRADVTEKADR